MKKDDEELVETTLFDQEQILLSAETTDRDIFDGPAPGFHRDEAPKNSAFAEEADSDLRKDADRLNNAEEFAEREQFSRPAASPGEETIPLNRLEEWRYHPCYKSRSKDGSMAGLLASAVDPQQLAPIEVLKGIGDRYQVKDGRWRLLALREQHGEDSEIRVRCVVYGGTEAEAVEEVCDQALGCTPRTQIETAHAVLNVQRIAGITQKAISERFPALKKDQVSRMTIAAKTVEQYPMVFDLLEEPDRVSIDLCVKFAQFMKTASEEDYERVLDAAHYFADEGASFKRPELFEALGIQTELSKEPAAKLDPLAPIDRVDIFGADDQPVGALEMLADQVMRLRLPDPATMTRDERESAAAAFIKQIRLHFELEVEG